MRRHDSTTMDVPSATSTMDAAPTHDATLIHTPNVLYIPCDGSLWQLRHVTNLDFLIHPLELPQLYSTDECYVCDTKLSTPLELQGYIMRSLLKYTFPTKPFWADTCPFPVFASRMAHIQPQGVVLIRAEGLEYTTLSHWCTKADNERADGRAVFMMHFEEALAEYKRVSNSVT